MSYSSCNDPTSQDEHQLLQKAAMEKLRFPTPPINWRPGSSPQPPTSFGDDFKPPPLREDLLLQWVNAHHRDVCIEFFPEEHKYEICCTPTVGSVTELVHQLTHPFNTDIAIDNMMNSKRWPRPEYTIPNGVPMSREEIKEKWRLQGTESANLGTWTHYLIELFLNRETINYHSKELKLFLKFLASLNHCVSYRTEWRVFAEDLKLAGSIDFVAKAEDETMIIIDWKRSKDLGAKYENNYANMLPPLHHLPDCKGIHYRLQLNVYRYILEKYYGFTVSSMLVVSVHPDYDNEPFVDIVPKMDDEVRALVRLQCSRVQNDSQCSEPIAKRRRSDM